MPPPRPPPPGSFPDVSPSVQAYLPYVSLVLSLCGLTVAIWVAIRAGQWRDSDSAKALLARVDETESRLDKLEPKVSGLATKADISSLKSELDGLCRQIDKQVVPGLNRIEDYFLKAGMGK
jgi:hypothetical protein